eukprot:scaffold58068_cov33-Phaeocystis_antarctica.AAC.3
MWEGVFAPSRLDSCVVRKKFREWFLPCQRRCLRRRRKTVPRQGQGACTEDMRRIRVAEPDPEEDELQRSLSALHSIGQQAARLEQMATTVSSNSASRTNLFESSQYQPASAWGEDADAYRGHIEA